MNTLHAGLGCVTGALGGGDCASGAMSGVIGEVTGEAFKDSVYGENTVLTQDQKNIIEAIGGTSGAFIAILTGSAEGLSDSDIASNMYSGQRIGKNAVENNLLYHVTRDLDSNNLAQDFYKSVGNHSFDVWVPDNPNEATSENFSARGLDYVPPVDLGNGQEGWIIGGYLANGNLIVEFNESTDLYALQNHYSNGNNSTGILWDFDVEIRQVNAMNGMSDTDFGYNLISNAQNYQNNTYNNPINYSLLPALYYGYNCNSFSNTLLRFPVKV